MYDRVLNKPLDASQVLICNNLEFDSYFNDNESHEDNISKTASDESDEGTSWG